MDKRSKNLTPASLRSSLHAVERELWGEVKAVYPAYTSLTQFHAYQTVSTFHTSPTRIRNLSYKEG